MFYLYIFYHILYYRSSKKTKEMNVIDFITKNIFLLLGIVVIFFFLFVFFTRVYKEKIEGLTSADNPPYQADNIQDNLDFSATSGPSPAGPTQQDVNNAWSNPSGLGNLSGNAMVNSINKEIAKIQDLIKQINTLLPGSINDIRPRNIVTTSNLANIGISIVNEPYQNDSGNLVGCWFIDMTLPQSPNGQQGPAGPPGDQGPAGIPGPAGEQGPRGPWASS